MGYSILLSCVILLSAALMYISNTMIDFFDAAIHVYCEKREDYPQCSKEFREKTSKLMKEKK